MLKPVMCLIYLLGMVLFLSGCASAGTSRTHFVSWQEEVKLNDGRVIVATQKRLCERAYTGQEVVNCIERESWITVSLPEFSKQPIVWNQRLMPHILNIHNGKLYVVGWPPTQFEFKFYGSPRPPYVGYRFDGESWVRIPFKEIPLPIYDTNLVVDIGSFKSKLLTLTLKATTGFNGDPNISREQIKIDPNLEW